ncbi:unnamed protein product [Oikopleura dioica]|uniref:DOT1 domain-containing protein n=1 Tax=Oikopleura dioica TaxID=34765 RepID=E4XAY5_OIKDI|nr:unnamed protein product [Oikopleura dioica]
MNELNSAKFAFLDIYHELKPENRCRFARWVGGFAESEIDSLPPTQTEETLIQIADTLRMDIEPPGGKLPNEITRKPEDEEDEVVEVDEFLYPDNVLKETDFSTSECAVCKSKNINDLEMVSHSMSQDELTVLFEEIKDFDVMVDIGSRTGCILYAAHLMTKAKEIIGIEIDDEWCKIQDNVVQKFGMQDRIKIVSDDVKSEKSKKILSKADLTIMNNPFQWFSKDNGKQDFECILKNLKAGSRVLLCHIEEKDIPVTLGDYLVETTPENPVVNGPDHAWIDELKAYRIFKVLEKTN